MRRTGLCLFWESKAIALIVRGLEVFLLKVYPGRMQCVRRFPSKKTPFGQAQMPRSEAERPRYSLGLSKAAVSEEMLWEYTVGMTTVTVQLDEKLLEKARGIAAERHASLDDVVADALERIESGEDRAAGFLTLMKELRAKGAGPLPKMTREERNERR